MTRDYKNRTSRRGFVPPKRVPLWRWLLAAVVAGSFVVFLVSLKDSRHAAQATAKVREVPLNKKGESASKLGPKGTDSAVESPRFEFFTILPAQEVEIPETEIKALKSEEKRGKTESGSYILQVGSFKNFKDADRLKAELALQGIHSKIESTEIGDVSWNRVKIGPINSMTAVDKLRQKLKARKIDAIVVSAK